MRNTDGGVFHVKIRKKFKIKLRKEIELYIKWYNEDRIKTKLNGMSPIDYRLHSA
ncbi:IS3 family transposase (plasmid) [Anaerococcus martiniensis]|uniref:IS3 family transposase n=1 Tax=Anaerococcus sp. WGS1579 TaxID=3366809 RepID=UPI00372D6790